MGFAHCIRLVPQPRPSPLRGSDPGLWPGSLRFWGRARLARQGNGLSGVG